MVSIALLCEVFPQHLPYDLVELIHKTVQDTEENEKRILSVIIPSIRKDNKELQRTIDLYVKWVYILFCLTHNFTEMHVFRTQDFCNNKFKYYHIDPVSFKVTLQQANDYCYIRSAPKVNVNDKYDEQKSLKHVKEKLKTIKKLMKRIDKSIQQYDELQKTYHVTSLKFDTTPLPCFHVYLGTDEIEQFVKFNEPFDADGNILSISSVESDVSDDDWM
jgi:hypothetical protein